MKFPSKEARLIRSLDILEVIAHPLRLRILSFIHQRQEVCVNEIFESLGLQQSVVSQHLRLLRDAELVQTHREGRFIFYRLHQENLHKVGRATSHLGLRGK